MPGRPSIHAVYFVLNDLEFLGASLASVYELVDGVTVITRYDRDLFGTPRPPDGLVELVLSRRLDPERKVNLVVTNEGTEPGARNRAMAYAEEAAPVRGPLGAPGPLRRPDLFWHVDADEVYDRADAERLLAWAQEQRARAYLVELRTYFKSWNWRVTERGNFIALTRPGFRFGSLRTWYPSVWARGLAKLTLLGALPERHAVRGMGAVLVPPEVAVCHHGSYVGPRSRMEAKLASSPHRHEFTEGWLERVWDPWTPESLDFHPTTPERFPRAVHVATAELPAAVRDHLWPEGWIERGP